MEVMQAIHERRTTYDVQRDRAIPRDTLLRCLEAGRWGQNHKLTEPWRYTVVGPETRARIAEVLHDLQASKADGRPPEVAQAIREKAVKKAEELRTQPALVVVSMVRTPNDPLREREDYAAVATAVQNVALALWDAGIGMQWGTGDVTRDPRTYKICGLDPQVEEIVGFLKIGYPERVAPPRRRPFDEVLRDLP